MKKKFNLAIMIAAVVIVPLSFIGCKGKSAEAYTDSLRRDSLKKDSLRQDSIKMAEGVNPKPVDTSKKKPTPPPK